MLHLWHVNKKKVLRIGSVSLINEAVKKQKRNFTIHDWPLLILRCLLILFIAMILAVPIYQRAKLPAEKRGWIMIEKQHMSKVWKSYHVEIDSLLRRGYQMRDFNHGFSRLELKDTIAQVAQEPSTHTKLSPLSYFSLVRQLDAELSPGDQVFLYTDSHMDRFQGAQPVVTVNLNWKFIPSDLSLKDVKPVVRQRLNPEVQILIYNDKKDLDASYLKAAIAAIAGFTKRQIRVTTIKSIQEVSPNADLVFWLADHLVNNRNIEALPKDISFFQYAGHRLEKTKSVLQYESGAGSDREIEAFQRYQIEGKPAQTLWKDGFDQALLTLDTRNGIKDYRFYSRFNQRFSSLVWTDKFLMALLPIIFPQEFTNMDKHIRNSGRMPHPPVLIRLHSPRSSPLLASAALRPGTATSTLSAENNRSSAKLQYGNLISFFWWMALFILFLERLVAYRKSNG